MLFYALMMTLSEGERDFAENLYTQYEKQIYSIAFRIVNNKHDAEDIVNTVMVNVIGNLIKFIGKSGHEIKSQLVIYSRNAAIDVYRKNDKRSKKESSLVICDNDDNEDELEIPDNESNVEDEVISKFTSDNVAQAIGRLSDDDRDIIKLRLLLDYSSAEAAVILNISPNAVNKRLSKAKKRLKTILSDAIGGDTYERKILCARRIDHTVGRHPHG